MHWPPDWLLERDGLVTPVQLGRARRNVQPLLHQQVLNLFRINPHVSQDSEGLVNVPQDGGQKLLHPILEDLLANLVNASAQRLGVLVLPALLVPALLELGQPLEADGLAAHGAILVARLLIPVGQAVPAHGVAADHADRSALLEADGALHFRI